MTAPSLRTLIGSALAADVWAPMRHTVFRRIWFASLMTNLGLLIQGVGAAWAMTQLTSRADWVALVQTALMLPVMLVSLPAGALADMYDRRVVGLWALWGALLGAVSLSVLSFLGLTTPEMLLGFCFAIGAAMALFGPAWQASVAEQVPTAILPSAVALNSISYNIARSFGPAVGGMIVAAAGATAAFVCNAVLYLPLLFVLHRWRRALEPRRLPPERLSRAIVSGIRYVIHAPTVTVVLMRSLATGVAGGALPALMPLLARDILHGDARTYGVMLGAFGVGAVIGALQLSEIRRRMSGEAAARLALVVMGVATAGAALSPWPILTALILAVAGGCWMVSVALFNIAVQLSTPRWVAGRTLASFQTAIAGGIAGGSWAWGLLAQAHGVQIALLAAAVGLGLAAMLGLVFQIPTVGANAAETAALLEDPEVSLALTPRSGPVVIEIDYRVPSARARDFHRVMQEVQLTRQRTGAYGWSIARDIADPDLWTERWHCPTWLDYLRMRNRPTAEDRALQQRAFAFHAGPGEIRIRRMLERPFGSVRFTAEAPDAGLQALPSYPGP